MGGVDHVWRKQRRGRNDRVTRWIGEMTNPVGLAKRCLRFGLIVPVDEAEEAEEADDESSSCADSDNE